MEAHRLRLAAMLNSLEETLAELQSPTTSCKKRDEHCDKLLHSAIFAGLTLQKAWPLKKIGQDVSPWEISWRMRKVCEQWPATDPRRILAPIHYGEHKECSSQLRSKVYGVITAFEPHPRLLGSDVRAHMERARLQLLLN